MPVSRENIEKWSWKYWLLRNYQNFIFRLYFKTEIVGLEKIPKNSTLIFAPNHQNALMDALAILVMYKNWQPVFLARADIFKKPLVIKILTFLKIMPVYRIRDGYENLSLNDEIFLKTMDVLNNKNGLVVLPEGNHAGFKRLRQLKKGIARIAFQAEDASNGNLNILIVPVGLEYSNYVRFHSKFLMRIGEPFEIKKYLNLYHQNKALAYNAVIDELSKGIKKEIINIEDEENYTSYLTLCDLFSERFIQKNKLPKTQNQKFLVDKKLIANLDELKQSNEAEFSNLMQLASEYEDLLKSNKICSKAAPLSTLKMLLLPFEAIILLLTLPFFLYGAINNLIPIITPYKLSLKFEDVQFHSSIRHVVAMIMFPLMYLIQTLIFGLIIKDGWLTLAYLASLPIGAAIVYHWRYRCIKFFRAISLLIFMKTKPTKSKRINELFNYLFAKIENLTSK
ncbi:MAG: 1-acyl-sn-glycerol-3-phosphate acyltransferase [Bacteroidales bacterium]